MKNKFFTHRFVPASQIRRLRKGMVIIMKMNRSVKKSFVVIGKEGSTLDGDDFIQKLWNDAKYSIWRRKMKMEIYAESGVRCLIFPAISCPGRILTKGSILRAWSATMTLKLPMAGQNGRFPVTNIFMWNVKVVIFSQRRWDI